MRIQRTVPTTYTISAPVTKKATRKKATRKKIATKKASRRHAVESTRLQQLSQLAKVLARILSPQAEQSK